MRLSQTGKDLEFKVVVLGDKGTGKTSLVTRFIDGHFSPIQNSTIGAFFLTKRIQLANGSSFKMQLWDTAGQERFKSMAKLYYRGAADVIVCCDITSEETFIKMKEWILEIQSNASLDDLCIALSCNKSDLEDQRCVSQARVEAYAVEINASVFLTSAKEDIGISGLFDFISAAIFDRKIKALSSVTEAAVRSGLDPVFDRPQKKSGCC